MSYSELQSEAKANYDALASFLQSSSTYLSSGSGTPPNPIELANGITTDVASTISERLKNDMPGFAVGSISNLAIQAGSIRREVFLASASRASFYDAAVGELQEHSANTQAEAYKGLNYVRGSSIEQTEGL